MHIKLKLVVGIIFTYPIESDYSLIISILT